MTNLGFKSAMKTLFTKIKKYISPKKKTCCICFDEDLKAKQMFTVAPCHHQFCLECVKRHIEVRLLEGSLVTCPHHGCNTELSLSSCVTLLTPVLIDIWVDRMREDSIPLTDRIYCPNPRCSALMSETELSRLTKEVGVMRCCVKCGEPFCVRCKVSWHSYLPCIVYKRLHPVPTANDGKLTALADQNMWRQCEKCQHMIELSEGCIRVRCRCGHEFCYQCGAEAGGCTHGHAPFIMPQLQLSSLTSRLPWPPLWLCILFVIVSVVIIYLK